MTVVCALPQALAPEILASPLNVLILVFNVLFALLILGEPLRIRGVGGVICIVVGTGLLVGFGPVARCSRLTGARGLPIVRAPRTPRSKMGRLWRKKNATPQAKVQPYHIEPHKSKPTSSIRPALFFKRT